MSMSFSADATVLPLPEVFQLDVLFKRPPHGSDSFVGFPRGSTLMLTGQPGAGKSFFALSLVREQIYALAKAGAEKPELLYLGVGFDRDYLERRYKAFGWFDVHDEKTFVATSISVEETALPLPTSGAEDLINPILTKLRHHMDRRRGRGPVFLVVDTLGALVKGSLSDGDRQRSVNELLSRIRTTITKNQKVMCVLIDHTANQVDEVGRGMRETIADYVFHLGFRDVGGGRLNRSLIVRKCPDYAPLALGEHSWEIVHPSNLRDVFAPKSLRKSIELNVGYQRPENRKSIRWGVLAIIPHIVLPEIGTLQSWIHYLYPSVEARGELRINSGVPGLDEMLTGERDYWARPSDVLLTRQMPEPGERQAGTDNGLFPGSVTFLIGRAGTGKSNCAIQFLLAHNNLGRCLYVNFENRPQQIHAWYPGHSSQGDRLRRCHSLYRRRSQLDLNLLAAEIRWMVKEHRIERIAFDGLSDVEVVIGTKDFSLLIEELVAMVRMANLDAQRTTDGQPPTLITIFISLEANPDSGAFSSVELKDSPADNVVVFRQVTINDVRRKTVEVRKARGQDPDRQVRELIVRSGDKYPLRILPGLDNYRQLAGGNPEPVRVALQLVSENRGEEIYNSRLTERLRLLFGYEVTPFGFSRGEIASTLLDIASGMDRIPFSDVKLLHVDEWWVRELRVKSRRLKERLASLPHPLLRLNEFLVTDPSPDQRNSQQSFNQMSTDFWAIELEKSCIPIVPRNSLDVPFRADVISLPSYADFGIFSVNRAARSEWRSRPWKEWLDDVPRVWAHSRSYETEDGTIWWFAPPSKSQVELRTVVDYMLEAAKPHEWVTVPGAMIGFAFDMETPVTAGCALLELCWAFGATEDFLVRDIVRDAVVDALDTHPMTRALEFLMYLVVEGLMPPRTTLKDVSRAVFSRHWYSSIPDVDKAARPSEPSASHILVTPELPIAHRYRTSKMFLVPIPFFPIGAFPPVSKGCVEIPILVCLQDAIARFDRLLQRLMAAVDYREGIAAGYSSCAVERAANSEAEARRLREAFTNARELIESKAGNMGEWEEETVYTGRLPKGATLSSKADFEDLIGRLAAAGEIIRDVALGSPFFSIGRGYERTNRLTGGPFDPVYPHGNPPADFLSKSWRHLPYSMFVDIRDVTELLRWHDLRVASLRAALAGHPLSTAILGSGEGSIHSGIQAVTGFACEGSWMIGADRATRSPSLSAKFLSEIASLPSHEDRAWLGAGIPARKDFYDLHGTQLVPCIPHPEVTWNSFLVHVGSRARRRSRSFCARVRVSATFQEIDRLMFSCLHLAGELRKSYSLTTDGSTERSKLVYRLTAAASEATKELFDWLRREMCAQEDLEQDGSPRRECVTCPFPEKCMRVFNPIEGKGGLDV